MVLTIKINPTSGKINPSPKICDMNKTAMLKQATVFEGLVLRFEFSGENLVPKPASKREKTGEKLSTSDASLSFINIYRQSFLLAGHKPKCAR